MKPYNQIILLTLMALCLNTIASDKLKKSKKNNPFVQLDYNALLDQIQHGGLKKFYFDPTGDDLKIVGIIHCPLCNFQVDPEKEKHINPRTRKILSHFGNKHRAKLRSIYVSHNSYAMFEVVLPD